MCYKPVAWRSDLLADRTSPTSCNNTWKRVPPTESRCRCSERRGDMKGKPCNPSCPHCSPLTGREGWKCVGFSDADARLQLKTVFGVYAIQVASRGMCIESILRNATMVLDIHFGHAWPLVKEEAGKYLKRLESMANHPGCTIVYIGRSGTKQPRDLFTRVREFANGLHIGWPALWALVCHGWELRFCWRECVDPARSECELMREFRTSHGRSPEKPPLNKNWPPNCSRNDLS